MTITKLRALVRNLLQRRRVDREIDAELRETFEQLVDEARARGASEQEARRTARLQLGDVSSLREQVRDARAGAGLSTFVQDVRYGARLLRRSPVFAVTAVCSLGIGIGGTAAVFSLVDVLMLRDLRVHEPERLLEVGRITQYGSGGSFSYPLYQRLRDGNRTLAGLAAMSRSTVRAAGEGERAPLGRFVSGNFFPLLGATPFTGRLIGPDDDRIVGGATQVAVVSHGFWQRDLGGGQLRTLRVDGVPFEIVGVLPPGFGDPAVGAPSDFFIPIASEHLLRRRTWLDRPDFNWLALIGRLPSGVERDAAQADLAGVFTIALTDFSSDMADADARARFRAHRITLLSARHGLSDARRQFSRPVMLLFAAVGLVLLIACANVVSLLLARGVARQRELALRLAIGASRMRLAKQLLTESALLGMIGGGLGLLIAFWAAPVLVRLAADGPMPIDLDVSPDARVLLFTAALALGSSLLAGILPAVRAARADGTAGITGDRRSAAAARTSTRRGQAVIAAQVALSLILLVGAVLLIQTLRNLRGLDAGFDREQVLLVRVDPVKTGIRGARLTAYYRELVDRVRAAPGVAAASLCAIAPISGGGIDLRVTYDGAPTSASRPVYVNLVSDGYFATMRTPLLRGRDLAAVLPQPPEGQAPDRSAGSEALVNEALARRDFPAGDPIGHALALGPRGAHTIVGVVADSKYMSLREAAVPTVFLPALTNPEEIAATLAVRTQGDAAAASAGIRAVVSSVSPAVPVSTPTLLSSQVERSLGTERLVARLLTTFSLMALGLAAVGLYGLLGYSVARRTAEIGVRLALGSSRGAVLRTVLAQSTRLVAIGIVLGMAGAVGLSRLVGDLVYGTAAMDPSVVGAAIACLVLVALTASIIPAWRASRVDPLTALRQE